MKNLFLLLCFSMCLVSCKEISGTLQVQESFMAIVNNKCGWDPFSSCEPTKKIEIPYGNYSATINFSSKSEISINMKANAFKETIILKRPKNFEFPENGHFQLTSAQVNQTFDIQGRVTTTVTDSNSVRENESCTYTVNDYVCYPGSNGQPQCGYQNRTVWGYRYVEYFIRNTTKNLVSDFFENQKSLAQFSGEQTEAEKIYLFTSRCH